MAASADAVSTINITSNWRVTAADDAADGSSPYTDWVPIGEEPDELAPPPALVESLYASLAPGQTGPSVLSLLWKCPGRVGVLKSERGADGGPGSSPGASGDEEGPMGVQLPDMSDFDFAGDELAAAPVKTPRRRAPGTALRGSARKKSTSFHSILKNMKRTREMEAREAMQESSQQPQ